MSLLAVLLEPTKLAQFRRRGAGADRIRAKGLNKAASDRFLISRPTQPERLEPVSEKEVSMVTIRKHSAAQIFSRALGLAIIAAACWMAKQSVAAEAAPVDELKLEVAVAGSSSPADAAAKSDSAAKSEPASSTAP